MSLVSDIIFSNLYANVSHAEEIGKLIEVSSKVQIICPFISVSGADWLIKKKSLETSVEIITELSSRGVLSGTQCPIAIEKLKNSNCEVNYISSNLHAKLYIFDNKKVVITSANLTKNGMENNFEMGVLLRPGVIKESFLSQPDIELMNYIGALWNFVKRSSEPVTPVVIESFKELKSKFTEEINLIKNAEENIKDQIHNFSYSRFQRNCMNKQNIHTDLKIFDLFNGFKERDWHVFDHEMDQSDENIKKFRNILNNSIDPILLKFYKQLKHETVFQENIGVLQIGISRNVQLKQFPDYRYIYLTKSYKGKRPNKHIGEPSLIIGMGIDKDKQGWLEVRAGVEEVYFNELTKYGKAFINNMIANIEEVIKMFNSLSKDWYFSHGNYSKKTQEYIKAQDLTKDNLHNILNHYLSTNKEADIHIRRGYHMGNPDDKIILTSAKITSNVALDFQKLIYFFNLAHM